MDLSILLRPGVPAGPGTEGLPLEPGRLLTARVLSVGEDGVRLRLLGKTVAARSLVPLRAGDLLRLRVEGAEGGVLRLRLLAPVPAPAAGPPAPPGGDPPGAPRETLKGVLLRLFRSGEAGPAPAVQGALEALTARQALSAAPADPGAGGRFLVFHLPVAFGEGTRTLEVAVEKPPRRPRGEAGAGNAEAGEAPLTVHLRLEPPHLGELRVRLVLAARRVGIALAAREAETVRTLEAGREALERRLEACGFALDGVDVRSLPPREEEAPAEARAGATAPRGIDLVL